MGHDDEQIKDLDPPVAPLLNTAAAVDVAAGALLLVFSELIHNVIGAVLIVFGLYLFWYAGKVKRALARVDSPSPDAAGPNDSAG